MDRIEVPVDFAHGGLKRQGTISEQVESTSQEAACSASGIIRGCRVLFGYRRCHPRAISGVDQEAGFALHPMRSERGFGTEPVAARQRTPCVLQIEGS